MSDESEFTINVKVNGLEDVERLSERIRDIITTHGNAEASSPSPRFSIGDVVSLVSGGPAMTVSAIDTDGEVSCVWFTPEDERRSAMFQPDCLEF